ncbi:energy-coupling factor transporter transmembrane component T [Clostridium saccharobutylicum]|uniref:ABC-type cobalt transport system, permease component CbiQ n=1 Tax=Clostridium saccharobutylicum DSM 13864 TaxID=1345695 RepID=U5MSW0_CLOSA|nr:energy-coupling factor transporter transmembrane component T [Clostridium saccharobutylicum]AGX42751.1 ABC-type cobalt transport system, permease component CbiQ [Clostridium saccharobutylicum DSM 13864]AQR90048.1 nickel transport protein NikQ [Clostridium saccharobutylicum]AQR99953.1 nickel transport protein NikQ [Clostridium saccharobutylicum]AQS09737.1 nickel transport protein NikQ [Clostridium saccharobutylicum]AQS13937.1 nickel transport protein NikQ [Clostridium saccharobutylicum]
MIPEWLSEKDDYIPKEEKSLYIEKSIFSFIRIISIIRQNKNENKLIYLINPTLKVISSIIMVLCVSISRSFIYLLLIDIYVLLNLFLMEKKSRKRIFLRSLIFPVMTLIALIPSILYGNIYNSLMLFQKLIITILIMNLLSHNTKWSEISKSLKLLKIPDIFIWIMDITIKYIVLLGEYSINLLYALKLRSIGITSNKYNSLTGIMGNLFIKSYKMSEEMFNAMECRGFIGEYTAKINFKLNKIDYIYCAINIMLIILFVYL